MKWYVIACMILVLGFSPAHAETMYISEIIEITLRTGPGIDHKVIAMVPSGISVEVLERGPEWSRVRLPSEREGYVLSRFLTDKKPNDLLLKELQQRYQALEEKSRTLREAAEKHRVENETLKAELAKKQEIMDRVTESYESLRKDSAEFLNLKANNKKMAEELNVQSSRAEALQETVTKIQKQQIFRWVLTGAGILLAGFLIGMSSKRQRRRSSLL